MARIRSLHPGFHTDETTVSLSFAARLLLIGIWTESDDHGVFEWKPVTLKMRLMPVDNVDIPGLLEELAGFDAIKKFPSGGKEYGAVRNFCKYQRPKKPTYYHPFPDQLRTYVACKGDSSEPVPHQDGTGGENHQQMEDGGGNRNGNMKEEESERRARAPEIPTLPSEQDFAVAAEHGIAAEQVVAQMANCRAWYAAKGEKIASWPDCWRMWCLRHLQIFAGKPSAIAPAAPAAFVIVPGTPEWVAWEKHLRETGAQFRLSQMMQAANEGKPFPVPNRYPPAEPERKKA